MFTKICKFLYNWMVPILVSWLALLISVITVGYSVIQLNSIQIRNACTWKEVHRTALIETGNNKKLEVIKSEQTLKRLGNLVESGHPIRVSLKLGGVRHYHNADHIFVRKEGDKIAHVFAAIRLHLHNPQEVTLPPKDWNKRHFLGAFSNKVDQHPDVLDKSATDFNFEVPRHPIVVVVGTDGLERKRNSNVLVPYETLDGKNIKVSLPDLQSIARQMKPQEKGSENFGPLQWFAKTCQS